MGSHAGASHHAGTGQDGQHFQASSSSVRQRCSGGGRATCAPMAAPDVHLSSCILALRSAPWVIAGGGQGRHPGEAQSIHALGGARPARRRLAEVRVRDHGAAGRHWGHVPLPRARHRPAPAGKGCLRAPQPSKSPLCPATPMSATPTAHHEGSGPFGRAATGHARSRGMVLSELLCLSQPPLGDACTRADAYSAH